MAAANPGFASSSACVYMVGEGRDEPQRRQAGRVCSSAESANQRFWQARGSRPAGAHMRMQIYGFGSLSSNFLFLFWGHLNSYH